ncbi:immunoglobulin-like domain-containing protein, partial [Flammeovirga sp. EKP202]|uniref:immunoglobulin-like domain-containing protein n=1 Tax=Flammeovirga sp. EKP202 TaxID=2770592 RepID=UPI00199C01A3
VTLTATLSLEEETTTKTFDVTVIAAEKTIAELLQEASEALMITYAEGDNAESVTSNLTLPLTSSHASTVAWSSSNEAVISSDGTVTRPSATTTVTLTATLSLEEETTTKTFDVTVIAAEKTIAELLQEASEALMITYAEGDNAESVTSNL